MACGMDLHRWAGAALGPRRCGYLVDADGEWARAKTLWQLCLRMHCIVAQRGCCLWMNVCFVEAHHSSDHMESQDTLHMCMQGGAIYSEGTLTLTNCTLSGNTAVCQ